MKIKNDKILSDIKIAYEKFLSDINKYKFTYLKINEMYDHITISVTDD